MFNNNSSIFAKTHHLFNKNNVPTKTITSVSYYIAYVKWKYFVIIMLINYREIWILLYAKSLSANRIKTFPEKLISNSKLNIILVSHSHFLFPMANVNNSIC